MTKNEKLGMITSVVEQHKNLDVFFNRLEKTVGLSYEGELFNAVWGTFDLYLKAVQAQLDDLEDDWIGWFIYENGCGDKGYEAGWAGKEIKVHSVADLLTLMEMKPETVQDKPKITEFKQGKTYKAKIRTWDDMAEEYGVDDFLYKHVSTPKWCFTEHMEKAMPLSRTIVFVGDRWHEWVITPEMCEWIKEID